MSVEQVVADITNNLIPNVIPVPAMVGELTRLQLKGIPLVSILPVF